MSEAFILPRYPPWVALVVAGVGSLIFSALLQNYDWERRKFAKTATVATPRVRGGYRGLGWRIRVRRLSGTAVVLPDYRQYRAASLVCS